MESLALTIELRCDKLAREVTLYQPKSKTRLAGAVSSDRSPSQNKRSRHWYNAQAILSIYTLSLG